MDNQDTNQEIGVGVKKVGCFNGYKVETRFGYMIVWLEIGSWISAEIWFANDLIKWVDVECIVTLLKMWVFIAGSHGYTCKKQGCKNRRE